MLKLFGAILVIAACTGIGFNKSLEIADHEEMIKQIRHMVILLGRNSIWEFLPFSYFS